jgi:hypothetical protein
VRGSARRPPGEGAELAPASRGRELSWRERRTVALQVALGRTVIRLLGASLRLTEANRAAVEPLWAEGGPVIYAAWHGRMLMLPYLYGRRRAVHVLASRSRDGEIVSRFARGFGFRVVRGSTSRGAATAIRALARLLRQEHAEVGIVPDGPRGPRYVAQSGPVLLAKLGRAPIVPLGISASRATVLRSWDELLIPHPFARLAVVFGEPLRVPADADRAVLEAARQRLETALRRVTLEADRLVGARRVPLL